MIINRKSYISFRLVTLNDLERRNSPNRIVSMNLRVKMHVSLAVKMDHDEKRSSDIVNLIQLRVYRIAEKLRFTLPV